MKNRVKKFRDFDEEFYEDAREERRRHLGEKRMRNAIRQRDLNQLLEIEDEY